jgi:hypothetical protein
LEEVRDAAKAVLLSSNGAALVPSANEIAHAFHFFTSASAHAISPSQIDMLRQAVGIPVRCRNLVPPSRLTDAQLDEMIACGIADCDVAEKRQASVFAFLLPEPSKSPPRLRVIVDTLQANVFLPDAPKTRLRSTRQLLDFFGRFKYFSSFDFKCFYFQFPFSEEVSNCYIGQVRRKFFRMRRCPMGHKNAVKHCHCVSQFVAELAIFEASATQTSADVIIDNVAFGSHDADELRRVELQFVQLCERFGIVIGDHQPCGTVLTHRGLVYSSVSAVAHIKPSWCAKFAIRVAETIRAPSFERLRSLCGMINYVRIYYGSGLTAQGVPVGVPVPSSFYAWKALARWSQSPRRRFSLSPSVARQLSELSAFVAAGHDISVVSGTADSSSQILVTDACKNGPFSAWGAVLIDGDFVRVASGHFPFGDPASISALELRAVGCGLLAFKTELSVQPGSPFKDLVVLIDNTAALFCLARGASSVPSMWSALCWVSEACSAVRRILRPRYVPSAFNPADEPSRDKLLVPSKVAYARVLGSNQG